MGAAACRNHRAGAVVAHTLMVGRSPWTAADAPVGLLALCKTDSVVSAAGRGRPARTGGPPHQWSGLYGHRPKGFGSSADKDNRRNPLTTSMGAEAPQPLVMRLTAPREREVAAE